MIYLIVMYIIFSIVLIIKNHKNKNIIWFILMLIGFILAIFGLAFYTTYINWSCKTQNKLFSNIEQYIWMLNYYLKLNIFQQYRIMNIGTAVYIYGAMCFSIANMNIKKNKYYLLLAIIPLLLIIIYDPIVLRKIYHIYKNNFYALSFTNIDKRMKSVNIIFNTLIKSYLFGSVFIMVYVYFSTPFVLRKKYQYIIIGIIPISILFFVLFFRFPNHMIVFRRYQQLFKYSFAYNNILYNTISYLSLISVILLMYATLKYNIFEMNIRKTQINFENQVQTAHFGLKIFSHSIKNQFVAIKFLIEQLSKTKDYNTEEILRNQILSVCNESIDRLSSLSRKIGKIDLIYKKEDINQVLENIIEKYSEVYSYIHFELINKKQVSLYIDKKQFEKVLDNIIINSVEACKNKENYAKIFVVVEEKNYYGIVQIKDNGNGINKKNIKKVFRPFYTTKPTVSNWGVGLAFCQKVIDAFGGMINIESKEKEGTTVEIYIPNVRRI